MPNSDSNSRNIELTDDEFYWVSVAIETVRESAIRISSSIDEEDASEGNFLVTKWNELQKKFPAPEIGLRDTP